LPNAIQKSENHQTRQETLNRCISCSDPIEDFVVAAAVAEGVENSTVDEARAVGNVEIPVSFPRIEVLFATNGSMVNDEAVAAEESALVRLSFAWTWNV
jgi:hypothetical protein